MNNSEKLATRRKEKQTRNTT